MSYCADRDSDALHVQRFFYCHQKKFKIICGLYNDHLQERLFREWNDTSLEKIIQICSVAEAAAKQSHELKRESLGMNTLQTEKVSPLDVNAVHSQKADLQLENNARFQSRRQGSKCGYMHKYGSCPAYGKTCKGCNGKNHFIKVCPHRKQNVHFVGCQDVDSDQDFHVAGVIS